MLAFVQAGQGLTSVCKHCTAILSTQPGLILRGSVLRVCLVPHDALPIISGQTSRKLLEKLLHFTVVKNCASQAGEAIQQIQAVLR